MGGGARGAGGGEGGCSPSFCQIFAKSPFFASNFSISMPTAPSRSSQPPHIQIHSAVNELLPMFKKPQNLKGLTVNLVQGLLKQCSRVQIFFAFL